MKVTCRAASIFVILALAACAAGPNYAPPSVPAPDRFLGQSALSARDHDLAALHAGHWWEGFEDPRLNELIDIALRQNLDLARSIARVQQARAALSHADASLAPAGSVSAQASRARSSLMNPEGQILNSIPGANRTGNVFEADLGASWEIDLFGGLRRQRQSSLSSYQAARIDVEAARLAVAAQTADLYITVRALQTRLAITQDQVAQQTALLSLVRLQLSKGVASALQVDQAEGLLAQVQSALPALSTSLDAALNALDVMLGAQPGTYRAQLDQPQPIPRAPAIANAIGPAELIRRRPDLVVAERKLQASNAQIGVAVAEYYPKLSLSGLLGSASMGTASLFTPNAGQWQGAFGLRWRLFDFARVDAEVQAARGGYAEALAAYRLSVLRATEDVEDALSSLVNAESQENTLQAGEVSLTRARDASIAAYKGGVVSLIEVIDADTRLLNTRDALAQAQAQAARSAVASFRALGGGWNAQAATSRQARAIRPAFDCRSGEQ